MPLRDHFHPPLLGDPPWSSLYTIWVSKVVSRLNGLLPQGGYRAYANVRLGPHVEADVAEFRRNPTNGIHYPVEDGGVTTLSTAPPALGRIPLSLPDDVEVLVAEGRHLMTLAAVIEFVSPANKKERDERAAFVRKCGAYLQKGVGLMIVDVVTDRLVNLHDELMRAVGGGAHLLNGPTYVSSYAPVHGPAGNAADVWAVPAPVGEPIPTLPLYLRRGPVVLPELDATYTEALADSGL